MSLCKYGRDSGCEYVKMFCFSRANHASTNLKKFLSQKLDKFTLPTHSLSAETWKISTKHAVSIFFLLKLTF